MTKVAGARSRTRLPRWNEQRGWIGGDNRTLYVFTYPDTGNVYVRPGGGTNKVLLGLNYGPTTNVRVASREEAEEHWQNPIHPGWKVAAPVASHSVKRSHALMRPPVPWKATLLPSRQKSSQVLDREIKAALRRTSEKSRAHASRKKPRSIAYRLQLTPSERQAVEFASGRYAWLDMLADHLTEGGLVEFTEPDMWEWTEAVDSEGGSFPLASPAFEEKLQRFYNSQV